MYTRREFGKMTLAGLPLSLALGPIHPRVGGVRIGVQSYSFRTLPLDAAIKAMSEIGIGECELYSGHVEPRTSLVRVGRGESRRNALMRKQSQPSLLQNRPGRGKRSYGTGA